MLLITSCTRVVAVGVPFPLAAADTALGAFDEARRHGRAVYSRERQPHAAERLLQRDRAQKAGVLA